MIHLFRERDGFECWLDTENGGQHDGLCIGHGPTTREALAMGIKTLEAAEQEIQDGPDPITKTF